MIRGVIIGHGDFGRAMLSVAERIVGRQEGMDVVSNTGLSCESLIQKIASVIGNVPGEKIVFVDLPGGSCTISCMNLIKSHRELNIICGINLPILLEFFMLRDKYAAKELIPILIKKGKDNIFELGGSNE